MSILRQKDYLVCDWCGARHELDDDVGRFHAGWSKDDIGRDLCGGCSRERSNAIAAAKKRRTDSATGKDGGA